jgi:hypothetical protein
VIPSFSKRLSTEAKTVASRARGKGQPGGSVDPNERGRPVDGAGREISKRTCKRANRADRSAPTIRRASRIGCRIARRYASVNDFVPNAIMASDNRPKRGTDGRSNLTRPQLTIPEADNARLRSRPAIFYFKTAAARQHFVS